MGVGRGRRPALQSNLFITDTKGTGISVRIIEVSVLYLER